MRNKKLIAVSLILVLAIVLAGCGAGKKAVTSEPHTFTFEAYDLNGNLIASEEISTDKQTVGDALLEKQLIDGDNGQYGLYVKDVAGVHADYDTDGTYWAFYINGEYAMSGVDTTDIEDGATYTFRVEK